MHVKEQTKWPAGGGEAGALIRAHAWDETPLGALEGWPRNLKVVVDLVLSSGFPLVLILGREHILVYNDAFSPMLSQLHPAALGRPLFEVLPEVRPTIEDIFARVWAGETLSFQDQHFQVPRNGPVEDMWVDVAYGPIRDEAGAVAGILAKVGETTAKVLAERRRDEVEAELREREARQRLLVELGDRTRELGDATAFLQATVGLLGNYLGAGRAGYGEIDDDRLYLDVVAEWTHSQPIFLGRASIAACSSDMLQHFRSGRPWVVDDVEADARPAVHDLKPTYLASGTRALISVPLTKGGRWVGNLYVTSPSPRAWTESEVALVRDVAERTWVSVERARAENVLRESEAKFRAISEQAEVGIAMADLDGRIIYANDRHCDILALPRGAVVGQTIQQMTHVEDWPRNKQLFEAMIRCGEPFTIEKRLARPDGSLRWTRVTVSPRRDAQGRIIGGLGVTIDLTDRKVAEAALRASEARQAFLVELSDRLRDAEAPAEIMRSATELLARWLGVAAVGYGEFEPDGDTVVNGTEYNDGRMPSAQGRRRLSDHGPGFAPAMRAGQGVFTEDLTRDPRAPEGGSPATHAMQIRAGGAVPLVKGGRLVAYLYAVHPEPRAWPEEDRRLVREVADRTWATLERARAETALRQANRAKDEFLAILAHELRNPLAPVTNALELLTPGHADAHALEQARAMMARQVQQLVRLTDDLLDVSRISRGKVQLRRDRVPLADVVQQAVETSRPLVERGHNELTLELPTEPIFLDADPTRLAQVFSNLLNNAAKYSQSGGLISLRAERQDDRVIVRVRDTGIGIPSDMLQRVFEIFTQVDRSLEKAQGGLGVGLSLAKGLVELHGGSIEAHSDGHGRGSEFVVRLPMHTGVAEAAPRPVEDRPAGAALRRVLVVDDNEDAATSLAMLLKVMNCDARVAHGGFEALEVAPEFRPELVLLDLGMPNLNGYDTCRRMRAEPWGRTTKIVALTGWTKSENDQRAEEAGFDEHLVKPADRATISRLLRSLSRPEEAARRAPSNRPTA